MWPILYRTTAKKKNTQYDEYLANAKNNSINT